MGTGPSKSTEKAWQLEKANKSLKDELDREKLKMAREMASRNAQVGHPFEITESCY
jgi:hypothetical protein